MDSLMNCAVQNALNPGFSQKLLHRQLSLNNIDTEENVVTFMLALLQTLTIYLLYFSPS